MLIAAALPAHAQGPLVAWGDDTNGLVSGVPAGEFVAVAIGPANGVGTIPGINYNPASHAVALRCDGTLVSWGSDHYGVVSGTPVGTFSAVAAGPFHCLALRTDGTLVSWGAADPPPAGTFSAIAAGLHSVAIRTDGTLVVWGDVNFFQYEPPPAGTYSAVVAGLMANVAIRTDGALVGWNYECGGGPLTPAGTFVDIALSYDNSFSIDDFAAVRTDGTLIVFECGGGSPHPGPYTDVAAGAYHTLALRSDGTLESFWSPPLILGPPLVDIYGVVSGTPAGTFSAVAAGGYTSIAIAAPNNRPPVITCHNPAVLWSPNHELVDAGSAFSVDDPDGDPVEVSLRVFSDETEIPDTGDGTGRHAPDFKTQLASGAPGLFLRSERRAAENGRFYLGLITADDGNGGVSEQVCILAVCPHDQNNPASLNDVINEASAAAGAFDFPTSLNEHGLSAPLGPHQ